MSGIPRLYFYFIFPKIFGSTGEYKTIYIKCCRRVERCTGTLVVVQRRPENRLPRNRHHLCPRYLSTLGFRQARTSTKIDHVVLSYDTANPEQEWGEGKIPYGASSTYLGKSATLDRTDGHACNAATGNIVQPAGKKFPTRHGERVRDEGRKKGKLIL